MIFCPFQPIQDKQIGISEIFYFGTELEDKGQFYVFL